MSRPLVLVIIDGWGQNDDGFGNAIAAARTPVMDGLWREWPTTLVAASGEAVGLPEGQQGNSEVGHLTIGSGRITHQTLGQVSRDIRTGAFFDNPALCEAVDRARSRGAALHCLGLLSPGGVHSHQDHALAVVELAHRRGLDRVFIHAFTDGRDEPPSSAAGFVREFEQGLQRIGGGARIASVTGRYYAMDRDRRWDRIERAYTLLVGAGDASREGVADAQAAEDRTHPSAVGYIEERYAAGITDEFIEPALIVPDGGEPAHIEDSDSVVFFNFRPDRARQLSWALVSESFDGFERTRVLKDLLLVTLTEYEASLPARVAFAKDDLSATLAEVVSGAGLRQFHVAETEKYAHVTYFINGGREQPFPGEERLLIPSPRVRTYDTAPEMSAEAITAAVIERAQRGDDALIVLNFANPDMVGHTGVFAATVAGVEVVDACIGRIVAAVGAIGGSVLVTSDHGNAEAKIDRRDNSPLTAHTGNPVPVILCGPTGVQRLRDGGGLADIAPTVLGAMGLPQPAAMTGSDLAIR